MNFFDHEDLGNHLLQLCPKVVKHPVYSSLLMLVCWSGGYSTPTQIILVETAVINLQTASINQVLSVGGKRKYTIMVVGNTMPHMRVAQNPMPYISSQ